MAQVAGCAYAAQAGCAYAAQAGCTYAAQAGCTYAAQVACLRLRGAAWRRRLRLRGAGCAYAVRLYGVRSRLRLGRYFTSTALAFFSFLVLSPYRGVSVKCGLWVKAQACVK